jgi:Tfp pilus assembly protein PilE
MKTISKLVAGAALCLAPGMALAASDMTSPSQAAPTTQIPETIINKAGAALRDVAQLQEKYQPKMDSAGSEKAKQGLSEQANAEAVQAIQSHGLSVQEYSTVVRTAQSDPQVKQRLLNAANKD